MTLNCIDRFGVRQRCMEGTKRLTDLFLVALHYEHDVNFYIYENEDQFLGTINRELLLALDLSPENCQVLTLGELCKIIRSEGLEIDTVHWDGDSDLAQLLDHAFKNIYPFSEEIALAEKNMGGWSA